MGTKLIDVLYTLDNGQSGQTQVSINPQIFISCSSDVVYMSIKNMVDSKHIGYNVTGVKYSYNREQAEKDLGITPD